MDALTSRERPLAILERSVSAEVAPDMPFPTVSSEPRTCNEYQTLSMITIHSAQSHTKRVHASSAQRCRGTDRGAIVQKRAREGACVCVCVRASSGVECFADLLVHNADVLEQCSGVLVPSRLDRVGSL
jgi:hypothetical protein